MQTRNGALANAVAFARDEASFDTRSRKDQRVTLQPMVATARSDVVGQRVGADDVRLAAEITRPDHQRVG